MCVEARRLRASALLDGATDEFQDGAVLLTPEGGAIAARRSHPSRSVCIADREDTMNEQDHDADRTRLSDQAAQRLLARVVELDAYAQGTTIARLREVTRELGVSDATFARALE